mmetsp:Transcript_2409/g.4474  ORF Transcript_2409/g.4474 Transcript_2409/m.4474 type:complete len:158 (-) Transcript_2409:2506-2979(-)|eukprot:CAMPEP_0176496314 /NCGR_PEP_ID=MMETSP0200_2-20121128/11127_1 /TAXON_ID=947934 /ORGANISM="Chaetoceros sp., Strain GSL56" /LENGTH=157 /DNA_ID=CAMNT_0017894257 /DNA_START=95 /DNA_END=568 /DNA_ORIENTATION=+
MKTLKQKHFSTSATSLMVGDSLTPATRIILVLLLFLQCTTQTIATGYKPDPTHRYEHKEDIEKLLHPNQEVHTIQYPKDQTKRRQSSSIARGEDDDEDNSSTRKKALNVGLKNRPLPFMHSIVTNVLDVSATVERESVFTWKTDDVAAKNKKEDTQP